MLPTPQLESTENGTIPVATKLCSAQRVKLQKWLRKRLRMAACRSPSITNFVLPFMSIPRTTERPRWTLSGPPGRKRHLHFLCWRLRRRWRQLLWLRRLVANQPHFAEKVRHLHAGKRFEERRHLRGNFRDVAGELIRSCGVAVARGNDGYFVHFAERLDERAHDFRQAGDQFVDHCGLVVFLEGFGLDVHGLGFRFALLEDDLRFGFTLRANRGGAAFGFGHQTLTFCGSQRLDALALDFRLLQDGGDEFAFAARDFRFLHFYLGFALHLLDLHGLGNHVLLLNVSLNFIGLVGLRLRLLG